jgi:hypothetical protein
MGNCPEPRKDGMKCGGWVVKESDPPQCSAHGGRKDSTAKSSTVGAPLGNTNAVTHGAYTNPKPIPVDLSARITDLDHRIQQLSDYIDNAPTETTVADMTAIIDLHGRLSSRLGRLMRDRQALTSTDADELEIELREALKIASDILGVDLLSKKSTLPT